MTLLIYTYDVAGVSYEASQDVTHLRQFIDLYSCRLGLPASVKYDPHNPGDSIVISETWSGLRKSPIRAQPRPVASDMPALSCGIRPQLRLIQYDSLRRRPTA